MNIMNIMKRKKKFQIKKMLNHNNYFNMTKNMMINKRKKRKMKRKKYLEKETQGLIQIISKQRKKLKRIENVL